MNPLIDANCLFDAGIKSMSNSKFKYDTQRFEIRKLLEIALLQRDLMEGNYHPQKGKKFIIRERGKTRFITSNTMRDKTVNHVLCDEIVMPKIGKHLIYDNGASQKGKGVSFSRRRFEYHMHQYFNEYHINEGYALLIDFSGYYANIRHDTCKAVMYPLIEPDNLTRQIMDNIFQSFELDVSYLDDQQIEELYHTKVDPLQMWVSPELRTGKKFLKKGADIGNQLSQSIGITFPYVVDNFIKIVCGMPFYGRYTDDSYTIFPDKEVLKKVLNGIYTIADKLGLIINKLKTRIVELSKPFRFLQVKYTLLPDGKLVRQIHPKSVTRERRKLKAYKRLLDKGILTYDEIENSFKSWIAGNYKRMSRKQIGNMAALYQELFGRKPTWKKGHSRLRWLMEHS